MSRGEIPQEVDCARFAYSGVATGAISTRVAAENLSSLLTISRLSRKAPTRYDNTCRRSQLPRPCPCCGGRMIVIETFARGCEPKHGPAPAPAIIRIDTPRW